MVKLSDFSFFYLLNIFRVGIKGIKICKINDFRGRYEIIAFENYSCLFYVFLKF